MPSNPNGNTPAFSSKDRRPSAVFDLRIRDDKSKEDGRSSTVSRAANYVTPGTVVTKEVGFMRGHGTFVNPADQSLVASVVGAVERVNRLVTVRGIGGVYYGEVGDVVVGRITKVMQKRWKVDMNSRLDGILLLSAINLPTGELRRRSAEDELGMREVLKEGDAISAEIQSVYNDGSLALHTRSVKYGKLGPGTLVKVPSSVIKRRKNHIHNLPCGVSVILGNNGYIWISPLPNGRMPGTNLEEEEGEGKNPALEEIRIGKADRLAVARLKNCVEALSKCWLPIYDTSLMYAFEASTK